MCCQLSLNAHGLLVHLPVWESHMKQMLLVIRITMMLDVYLKWYSNISLNIIIIIDHDDSNSHT